MQALSVGLLLFSFTWGAPALNQDGRTSNKGCIHGHLAASVHPERMAGEGAESGEEAVLNLPDQESYSAALIGRITQQPVKTPVAGTKLRRGENKDEPESGLSMTPADVKDAKGHLKDEMNRQGYLPSQDSPGKSKRTRQSRRSAHYLTHLPQIRKIPRDFEGSGSPDLQVRGDNDIPPFSGDGQHFTHLPGTGGAVGPGPESSAGHTGLSGKAETVNPHRSGLSSNEIPGREGQDSNAAAARDKAAQGGGAGVSLVGGSNEITGGTNFRELPGKEGNRIDAGSQNAHQGKVEFHYPREPSKEAAKGGGSDNAGSVSYSEIPKSSKGSSRKDGGASKRNQVTVTEKQRFPGKGESQGLVLSSHCLGKEVKSDSSYISSSEGVMIAGSRTDRYGQNDPARNKGVSPRRGSWPSRKSPFHRRLSTRHGDSSESSSGSSSESDGD
ncbi:matrix extracellular phosphoglycoprotein [Psammomys obesus]|uniref:matrix extracellular phosphoglycoprotein n=1 Tax=Psammomys obesus TaxID=48139 RepID=UPI00245357C1|nr:matrix extracellular phosphoglycoprotein [Psammomys obesus]